MRCYHRKDWLQFRKEVIELDGGVCVRCGRGPLQGAILQVHHKEYLPGKLPWDYPYELCETLCKSCHAGEHGIVQPFTGWECIGYDDLGEISGECELCNTPIRHVFFVQHAKWPSLEVGETCCDHLTGTALASDHMNSVRRFEARQQRFIGSPRWKPYGDGAFCIRQKGVNLVVESSGQEFKLRVDDVLGKKTYSSAVSAKMFVFELIENGKLDAFLSKVGRMRTRNELESGAATENVRVVGRGLMDCDL